MDCTTQKAKLTAYLAHELPVEERSVIRQHLEQCPDCQVELDSLDQLNHLLDLQPIVVPPADLSNAIMAAIAHGSGQHAKDLSWREIVAWGMALLAGLCLLLVPALAWYWTRTTGFLPWQSLEHWGVTGAGSLATSSTGWWAMVVASRQGLLALPQSISVWVQTQLTTLVAFYAGHLIGVTLIVMAAAALAMLSVRMLSRWTDEWEENAGIKGWRN